MSAVAPAPVEILGMISGTNPQRLIGKSPDGKFALYDRLPHAQETADGKYVGCRQITPSVTLQDILRCATGVMAGESRALTWPHTPHVLALGWAVLKFELEGLNSSGAACDVPGAAAAPGSGPSQGSHVGGATVAETPSGAVAGAPAPEGIQPTV